MKHVNKWPLALYVCMNSIFKCFIGNRIEWSHIEWHYFSNWQVLLIQTSPCYCLLGSIYSPVKMFTGVGKGTLAFLIDPELLGIRDLSPLHPPPSIPPHPWGGRIRRTFGVREEDYASQGKLVGQGLAPLFPSHETLGHEFDDLSEPGLLDLCWVREGVGGIY